VDRLVESLAVKKRLWSEGEATLAGSYYTVRGAGCDPRPASPPRVMVGGGSQRLLTLAAREADTVGINTDLSGGVKSADTTSQTIRTARSRRFTQVTRISPRGPADKTARSVRDHSSGDTDAFCNCTY
jgi:alkanesulfonate monooxygenase SsuD/methylene tetrahydromethanopterin reductase-like flavin-dependent oxidoreductase (luciferase family)